MLGYNGHTKKQQGSRRRQQGHGIKSVLKKCVIQVLEKFQ